MFEVVNMDFAKRVVDIKEAQIAEFASEIKELKTSLQNAAAAEKTEIKASNSLPARREDKAAAPTGGVIQTPSRK